MSQAVMNIKIGHTISTEGGQYQIFKTESNRVLKVHLRRFPSLAGVVGVIKAFSCLVWSSWSGTKKNIFPAGQNSPPSSSIHKQHGRTESLSH